MVLKNMSDLWARFERSPENIDRTLIGVCALIWLIWLGMTVAAVVALIDLGRGFHRPTQNSHAGLLYIVIGVSALIILAAIPMLLRARRTAVPRPVSRSVGAANGPAGGPPLRAARRAAQSRADERAGARPAAWSGLDDGAVNRIWLRGTTELVSVMGVALTAVATATYLMAIGKDIGSWVGYGFAGVVLAAMPLLPWLHLRQLRARLSGTGLLA